MAFASSIASKNIFKGKIYLSEVQYSEEGEVAIIIVQKNAKVDEDTVIDHFEELTDLEYVKDVKIIFS